MDYFLLLSFSPDYQMIFAWKGPGMERVMRALNFLLEFLKKEISGRDRSETFKEMSTPKPPVSEEREVKTPSVRVSIAGLNLSVDFVLDLIRLRNV